MRSWSIAGLISLSLSASIAYADGMSFVLEGGEVSIKATRQRAVMWLRDGTWEIHIQPVFERTRGQSAWVVPFPVMPDVQAGSYDLFDQLELLSAPVFLRMRSEGGGTSFGCFPFLASKAGDQNGELEGGEAQVSVWDRGTVGELDYVVLSSSDGAKMAEWLIEEGYAVSSQAALMLGDFETEGIYFFAARLSSDVDPENPLRPVRFVLPDMDPPAYPLRLTRLGVPRGESLELTVWMVTPYSPWMPVSHEHQALDSYVGSRRQYDQALDEVFADRKLALVYEEQLAISHRIDRKVCAENGSLCIGFDELGMGTTDLTWCEEIIAMRDAAAWLSRYQARLDKDDMNTDLAFGPGTQPASRLTNVHEVWGEPESDTAAVGFLGLVLLAFAIRPRRR